VETLLFLSPFALFLLILPLAHFQFNSIAAFSMMVLIVWAMFVPLLALLVREKKEKQTEEGK
jgi:hypothetical protein